MVADKKTFGLEGASLVFEYALVSLEDVEATIPPGIGCNSD